MLKLSRCALIGCFILVSTSSYAENRVICPQYMKCIIDKSIGNRACHLPAGFENWKLFSTFDTKSSGRFVFYKAVYTQYSDVTTVTCRYGNEKGPYLILNNANNYNPLFEKNAQWIKRDNRRHVCYATFPVHCSFRAE